MPFDEHSGAIQSFQPMGFDDVAHFLSQYAHRLMISAGVVEVGKPVAPPDAVQRGYAWLFQERFRHDDYLLSRMRTAGKVVKSKQQRCAYHLTVNVESGLEQGRDPLDTDTQERVSSTAIK